MTPEKRQAKYRAALAKKKKHAIGPVEGWALTVFVALIIILNLANCLGLMSGGQSWG